MKVGVSFTVFGKGWEFFWGKEEATIALIELSGTILSVGITFSLKV